MNRNSNRNNKVDSFITAFCITTIITLSFVLFLQFENKHIEPYIKQICETSGKQEATRIITNCIDEVMLKESDLQNDLISISTDGDNNVKSIQTNTIKINSVENEVIKQINKEFSDSKKTTFKLPVGNVTPFYSFAGKGFNIKLRLMPLSNIQTEVKSDFVSAGINQTKHRLTLLIKGDTIMLMPTYKEKTTVEVEYLLAETVIIGEVPDYLRDVH